MTQMAINDDRTGLFIQRGPIGEDVVGRLMQAPRFAAGDAEFLDDSRPHEVQLRPLLPSERTPRSSGKYPRGARLLVFKPLLGTELRAIVLMPSGRSDNTPENVEHAIRLTARFDAHIGALFAVAHEFNRATTAT